MAELIRVRPKDGPGGESLVGPEWLERWPDDWVVIDEQVPADELAASAPTEAETKAAPAAPKTPSGKNKEN